MSSSSANRIEASRLFGALQHGDAGAAESLLPLVYAELRSIARSLLRDERAGHSLQPTDLVHEAYLRLVDERLTGPGARPRFIALATQVMRRVLVDHGRRRATAKRGGGAPRVTLDENLQIGCDLEPDILALDDALTALSSLQPRQSEIVVQRIFGGLTVDEVASVLGVSRSTVEMDWRLARAWLGKWLRDTQRT